MSRATVAVDRVVAPSVGRCSAPRIACVTTADVIRRARRDDADDAESGAATADVADDAPERIVPDHGRTVVAHDSGSTSCSSAPDSSRSAASTSCSYVTAPSSAQTEHAHSGSFVCEQP